MTDPQKLQDSATQIVLHALVASYLTADAAGEPLTTFTTHFADQASKLRESAIALQAALEKMRIANEKLALRMAEHKAFFTKYKTAE